MRFGILAVICIFTAYAQAQAIDLTSSIQPFGLGGHSCRQYDDTGRLFLYTEGLPNLDITIWLQQSDNGTKPNVPMPEGLVQALPRIPGCLLGKHHA